MKRPLKPDELRVWGLVAATVHPLPGRETPSVPSPQGEGQTAKPSGWGSKVQAPTSQSRPTLPHPDRAALGRPSPQGEGNRSIEPRRKHRIAKEREEIGGRLDLHGLDQDRARAVLEAFLRRAWDEGYRAVLVITGKGVQGDGVLKRRTPEWLAAPHLSAIVAGISEAHRRHGGEGALYVALKRKPKS
ncbi:MAG: DNA mismatch repair protein MutS [Phenylobacterium sp.]|nr:MAG: DNA mismatch repair protein MutS [Phenylobacterium sp.]